jgi:hypothetical protein
VDAQDALCQSVKDWPIPGKQNLKRVPVSLQAIRNQFAVIQMHFHFAIFVRVVILQRCEHFWFLHFHISVIFQKGAPGKGVAATGCFAAMFDSQTVLAFTCQFVSV